MESKNKNIFWEALLLAIFIFASGMFLGYLLEKNRTANILALYQQSELDIMDINIQREILALDKIDCPKAYEESIKFANRIYDEAVLLARYDSSNKISRDIEIKNKKYDLLRAILWTNLITIKEKCKTHPINLVYFYEYNSQDIDKKAEQEVFSKKLLEVKTKYQDNVILIPIAGNLDINSINYLKSQYNITHLPAILINESYKIESLVELTNLEHYLPKMIIL